MLRKIVILISFLSVLRAQYEDESPYPQTDEEMCVGQEDGLLFGLENECDSYYYCSGEIAYLDKCSDYCEGCQFDFKINDCNYAEEAQCFVDETQAPETTLPPQTQAPVTTTAAPPSQTTAISDVTCPTDKIEFLASANCSEYYICVYGTKVTMQCQDGFVFNVEDKKCDHPVYSPRCSGISMDNLNNVKCNRHGFYTTAYPMDCEKYVFCSEGIPMVQRCPFGTAWSTDHCVERKYAQCQDTRRFETLPARQYSQAKPQQFSIYNNFRQFNK